MSECIPVAKVCDNCACYEACIYANPRRNQDCSLWKPDMSWIPVSERLPDKQHDWVLVACKLHPEGFYGVPHIGELRNGVWWCDCYEVPLKDAGVEVTHWMPLPEPPKEVSNV